MRELTALSADVTKPGKDGMTSVFRCSTCTIKILSTVIKVKCTVLDAEMFVTKKNATVFFHRKCISFELSSTKRH